MPRFSAAHLALIVIGLGAAAVAGCSATGPSTHEVTLGLATPTPAPTASPTTSPTTAPTGSPTKTPTATPSGSGSATPTPAGTPTPTPRPSGTPTPVPTSTPTPPPNSATVVVSLTLQAPSAAARRRHYISPSTLGIALTGYPSSTSPPTTPTLVFSVKSGSANCQTNADGSRNCTGSIKVLPGTDNFIVTAYDQPPQNNQPAGKVLSTGTVSNLKLVAGETTQLPVVLEGVIASLSLSPPDTITEADGQTHVYSLGLNALDADKNYIVGNDPFSNTPAVSVLPGTDPGNTLSIAPSNPSVNPDPSLYFITYNGGTLTQATITASAPNVAATASADIRALTVEPASVIATVNVPFTLVATLPSFEGPYVASVDQPNLCQITNQPSAGYYASVPGGPVSINVTPIGPAPAQCIVFIVANVLGAPPPSALPTNLPTGSVTPMPGDDYVSFADVIEIGQ